MRGEKPNLTVIPGDRLLDECPEAPEWLSDHAKAEWDRVAPQLHDRNLLTPDALSSLENYCIAVGQVRDCEEQIKVKGMLISAKGGPKANPAVRMQAVAMREARLMATELCLTPHRQGKQGKEKGKSDDGWDSDLLG